MSRLPGHENRLWGGGRTSGSKVGNRVYPRTLSLLRLRLYGSVVTRERAVCANATGSRVMPEEVGVRRDTLARRGRQGRGTHLNDEDPTFGTRATSTSSRNTGRVGRDEGMTVRSRVCLSLDLDFRSLQKNRRGNVESPPLTSFLQMFKPSANHHSKDLNHKTYISSIYVRLNSPEKIGD